ncbi:MAG: hypothetical protein WAK03_02475 [Methylocystis sp.]|jgi:hypothetical protein
MNISLDEAINIHARALKGRAGWHSPRLAQARAQSLMDQGDLEGFSVWMRVGEQAALLLEAQVDAEREQALGGATH